MNVFMLVNEFINNDFLSHSCLPSLPLKEAIAQMDDTGCIFVIKENNELENEETFDLSDDNQESSSSDTSEEDNFEYDSTPKGIPDNKKNQLYMICSVYFLVLGVMCTPKKGTLRSGTGYILVLKL